MRRQAMLPTVAMAVAVALTDCARTPAVDPEAAYINNYAGQTMWLGRIFRETARVCGRPEIETCAPEPRRAIARQVSVDDVPLISNGTERFFAVHIDGKRVFVPWADDRFFVSEDPDATRRAHKAECVRRGGVAVGMRREQIYASCWGKPKRINTTIISAHTHEQLVYGLRSYLYLTDGVLTSIQTSEKP